MDRLFLVRDANQKPLRMIVYDDGTGINLKSIQYSRRGSNIQEKTEAFGGSFNLESVEGKPGFKMEVII